MSTLYRSRHSGTPSTIPLLQKSNQKLKKWMPPLRRAESHNKSKLKTSVRDQQVVPARANLSTSQLKNLTETQGREQPQAWKIQARLRLMRSMVRNERTAFQELCNHEAFLTKLNQDLVKTVQDMEDATALSVRALLQQHHVLGNIINILEYFNKKRVQEMNAELQEWEEKEEQKIKWKLPFIEQMKEEMPVLADEVKESQSQILDPREIVFEDVLLRRPRCTPDMAVILNIPMEDLLF
ncbi:PREDICTED: uncharacterized protein C20orf96 homolog [Dipodomys ordii]|uniref:Uncharacterized protein C20orf96 homolog n=1 Tax=Dipodomys ordii TaxID=10020 RepID=A0A1S3EQB4_DIPOR|nr:PREDICTED: uncharacterized protein C20orf96 homolog [Dipodomys ordii]